ncbi:MAG: NUDIX hydrolase [Candidatus Nanohaloarchaea archaeon]
MGLIPEEADRDFVAGAFIVEDGKVLLLKHSKLGLWLQPGGHIEPGETPDETAKRETREETGIEVELVGEREEVGNSVDLPKPFNVNLHPIREEHYHCDFQFLARVKNEGEATHPEEHDGTRWFSRDELDNEDVPVNVRHTARKAIEHMNK